MNEPKLIRETGSVVPAAEGDTLDPQLDLLPDPLPTHWLLGEPTLRARIKVRAEDFLVDEVPLYEPSGEGEHLYLRVQKRHMAHGELIDLLCRHYQVHPGAIGFAGMKDRVGVTQQTVSIHLPGRTEPALPVDGRIEVLWQTRHVNKLRRGHLSGNRFAIRLREIDPARTPLLWQRLKQLLERGVPDFFGPQRFGYRRNNHVLGRLLMLGRHRALLSELLGARGTPFPEHQRAAREAFDAGRFDESLRAWHRGDFAERAALRVLARGGTASKAVRAVDRDNRGFWVSALQSAIFNRVLSERVAAGTLASLAVGDVAYLHDKGAIFKVTDADFAESDPATALAARLAAFEVSPSGPLPGAGMVASERATAERERAAIEAFGALALLQEGPDAPPGTRRPLRVCVSNAAIEGSFDEHGPFVRLAFDLPKGAYATVLLRELISVDETPRDRAPSPESPTGPEMGLEAEEA